MNEELTELAVDVTDGSTGSTNGRVRLRQASGINRYNLQNLQNPESVARMVQDNFKNYNK